jgi:hypothetical protein
MTSESITTDDPGADPPKVDAGRTPNQIHITNATRAISSSTGALRVGDTGAPGGIGVVGNVYVGDTVTTQDLSVDNVISDFAVNTDDFFVDISESKVGVSTTQPHAELHVVGNVYVSSNLTVDADTLHVDAANDRVGVNTKNPEASLHLVGNAYVSGDLETDSNILMSSNVFIKGPGPTSNVVAIGIEAGYTTQGIDCIAIGTEAGKTAQNTLSVAVGYYAGQTAQYANATAVGPSAGMIDQHGNATAVGFRAGCSSQGAQGTAVGFQAGMENQGSAGVAIGNTAGCSNQGANAVAIGKTAGCSNQGSDAVAIGYLAGCSTQGASAVAIGPQCGRVTQAPDAVAIGFNCGSRDQGNHAVAIGSRAGESNQGSGAIAIGRLAGRYNQGSMCVAIGYNAVVVQTRNTTIINNTGSAMNATNVNQTCIKSLDESTSTSHNYVRYDDSNGNLYEFTSDDRVKVNEKYITHSLRSVLKLKPQTYWRKTGIDPGRPISGKESGLMAQDIYYDTPELKHLVMVPNTATPTPEKPPAPSDDPADDPDYSAWGPKPASYDALGLIPYIIKAVQEIVTELPRSKTTVSNTWGQNVTGLVVSADTNTHKTNTVPIVTLSNVYMDKQWYGVVSEHTPDSEDYDTLVDTKGDTRIWVTDVGGPLLSGDLLTTSNVAPGYTQKQVDDLLRSSTVAKVTQNCDFTTPVQIPIKKRKQELVNETYYIYPGESEMDYSEYKTYIDRYRRVDTKTVYRRPGNTTTNYYLDGTTLIDMKEYEITSEDRRSFEICDEINQENYNELSSDEQNTYTSHEKTIYFRRDIGVSPVPHPKHTEEEIVEKLVDVLDENGQIVWEDTANTVPAYTLVDHGTYKAALVTCKLV